MNDSRSSRPSPPRVGTETAEFKAAALDDAINGLAVRNPLASAAIAFVPWQKYTAIVAAVLLVACVVFAPIGTLLAVTVLCTIGYLLAMIDRLLLFSRGLDAAAIVTVTDEQARAIPDDRLPLYTILVPAYDEPEVVGDLIAAMTGLDLLLVSMRGGWKEAWLGLKHGWKDLPAMIETRRILQAQRKASLGKLAKAMVWSPVDPFLRRPKIWREPNDSPINQSDN